MLDVSAVDPTGTGYLRVAPTGEQPATTALNHGRGAVADRARPQPRRRLGQVTLTVTGATADLVVDLVGHTAP